MFSEEELKEMIAMVDHLISEMVLLGSEVTQGAGEMLHCTDLARTKLFEAKIWLSGAINCLPSKKNSEEKQ